MEGQRALAETQVDWFDPAWPLADTRTSCVDFGLGASAEDSWPFAEQASTHPGTPHLK